MDTLIVAFFVMLGLVTAMAVGVIFGRKTFACSCGGMKALGIEMDCEVCGGDPEYCEKSPFVSSPAASQSQDDLAQRVGK